MKSLVRSIAGLSLGFCLAAVPLSARANDETAASEGPAHLMRTVEIDGRSVQAEEPNPVTPVETRYGTQFNLVSGEQLRLQNSLGLLDALRNVPGVMAQKKNMVGSTTSHNLYIRGRGSSHPGNDLAIYFDGVPRSGLVWGQTFDDSIPVYAAGGMEVYKYPQPSSFGGGYGLVNVLPKFMGEEGQEMRVGLQGGSYGTWAEHTAFGLKRDGFDVYAAQSWISSDGYMDHSRGQQQSYYFNMGLKANDNWTIRFLANYVEAQSLNPYDRDGHKILTGGTDPAERYDMETSFATLTLANKYDRAEGYVKLYRSDTNFYILGDNKDKANHDRAFWSKQSAILSGLRARETFSLWTGGEIVAGFDLDRSATDNELFGPGRVNGSSGYFPDQTLFSPYLAVSHYFGEEDSFHLLPSAGFRYYRHNIFADRAAPQAGLVLGYGNTDLNFNYARGVNYPTPGVIQALASQKDSFDFSRIKPETVEHYELGLSHKWPGRASLGVSVFYDDGQDRLRFAYPGGGSVRNLSSAAYFKIKGLEINGTLSPAENLELFAGATWLKVKARGETGPEVDILPYTPDFSLNAGFQWRFLDSFRFSGDYQHLQGLYEGTVSRGGPPNGNLLSETSPLDDVNLVNLRLGYFFDHEPWRLKEGEIFVAVDNVFNADYTYNSALKMPGTTVMFGVDLKFN